LKRKETFKKQKTIKPRNTTKSSQDDEEGDEDVKTKAIKVFDKIFKR